MEKKKSLFSIINEVHYKTNKNRILICKDIIICYLKYKANYNDYILFEMYKINDFERNTILTHGINNDLIQKYNNPKFRKYFDDKVEFNKYFDKYLNYDWIELNGKNIKIFKEFCNKHDKIIIRSVSNNKKESLDIQNQDLKKLYKNLIENKTILVEEDIKYAIKKNIIIVTFLGNIVAAFLKVKNDFNKDTLEDHIFIPIDIDTGIINNQFVASLEQDIKESKIPEWEELKKYCETLCLENPAIGYVEWNICIGKNKFYLINGSGYPNHNLFKFLPHRNVNIGLLPLFKKIEERKVEQ